MAKRREIVELNLDEELDVSRREATSMSLPLAVQLRLDVLAERAGKSRASRAEIIGMLIAEADFSSRELDQLITNYRNLTVGEVILDPPEEPQKVAADKHEKRRGNVLAFERRGPGRPSRKAG